MDMGDRLDELFDRVAIEDCLRRYCRGLDRMDTEMAKSVYWKDSRDDHKAYIGPGYGLVDWANEIHSANWASWQHYITNMLIDLDGDTAHTETYYFVVARKKDSFEIHLSGGRNIDRLEKRHGRWAIAARINTDEWCIDEEQMERFIPMQGHLAMDSSDPSYERPLQIEREDRTIPLDFPVRRAST
jgi:hypothetical protein